MVLEVPCQTVKSPAIGSRPQISIAVPCDFADRSCAFNIRLMKMTASYEAWFKNVRDALSSINMPLEEWQKTWAFDFQAEFNAGANANDAAMKANRFWWQEQNKAMHRDCRLSKDCWLPRGHQEG